MQKPIAPGWRDTQDPAGVYKNNGEFAGMSGRSAQAKAARRDYKRKWAKQNPEKVKAQQERYWTKKAAEAAEQEPAIKPAPMPAE